MFLLFPTTCVHYIPVSMFCARVYGGNPGFGASKESFFSFSSLEGRLGVGKVLQNLSGFRLLAPLYFCKWKPCNWKFLLISSCALMISPGPFFLRGPFAGSGCGLCTFRLQRLWPLALLSVMFPRFALSFVVPVAAGWAYGVEHEVVAMGWHSSRWHDRYLAGAFSAPCHLSTVSLCISWQIKKRKRKKCSVCL